jgi:hypothetical protein
LNASGFGFGAIPKKLEHARHAPIFLTIVKQLA